MRLRIHLCQRIGLLTLTCALAGLSAQTIETVLHHFGSQPQGATPRGSLTRDPAGNFCGTTTSGGAFGRGTVYQITAAGKQTVIHSFTDEPDGAYPYSGVIRDGAGNLYGTTWYGGAPNDGTVYKIDTAGNETVLYSFTCGGQQAPS